MIIKDKVQAGPPLNEAAEGHYRELLITTFEMRVLSVLIGLICANILGAIPGVNISNRIVYVLWGWLAVVVGYLSLFGSGIVRRQKILNNLHFSYYFIGVSLATVAVRYLGGAEWVAFFIYMFDLIYANAFLERKRGITITAFTYVCYFGLIWAQYAGFIPHHRVIRLYESVYNNPVYLISTNVIVIGSGFFLISCSTGLFFKMKERRERVLVDSKNRFAVKSRQLEKLSSSLSRQIEENKQLKSATMDHIKKKEFELNAVRKNMEDQIDQLRKTQRSMYFMIMDLNNMRRELKSSRDNLEQKVRERSEELLAISNKLHRSERLAFLGKLAGSITHELRNPMAVIKNAAHFLDGKLKGHEDEKIRRYMEMIKKEIGIIDSIIEDIMGFARSRVLKLQEENIRGIINEAIEMLDIPDLVEVRKDFGRAPEVIMADAKQLIHAIVNIANNAIMAMNGNGTLSFRVFEKNGYVRIEISDTGTGIPGHHRDLIFEPLYSSKPKGTGLGLPIARMMVESQGGKIDFVTEPGSGTTFIISLPLRDTGGSKEKTPGTQRQ